MSWSTLYDTELLVFDGYLQISDRTHLNSGIQEVDSLGNLQITSGRVIKGLEVGIRL